MRYLLCTLENAIFSISLNRPAKSNAFDDELLKELQSALDEAIANPLVNVIVVKAVGKHFSAGADVAWMQRMVHFSEEENKQDALVLAKVMHTLFHSPKPTIASVQGAAFGGGAGLVAACDIAIASRNAYFCFSEVKLGLIPAVISPYVVKAIGERTAKWLFMTAHKFNAVDAKNYNLITHCVEEDKLETFTLECASQIAQLPIDAVRLCKVLVENVAGKPITSSLIQETATLIAQKRVSKEGQAGLQAFLNKDT